MGRETDTSDFLVIGACIMGVSVALEFMRSFSDCSILVLEKENRPGLHASGRNSGVLHAGFYYTEDSMKARFCRDGNEAMRRFIQEKGLPLNECGKLVVTRSEEELPQLEELLRRGRINGVDLEAISTKEAEAIEPRVKTVERAIWSPNTATSNPGEVIAAMIEEAESLGIRFRPQMEYLQKRGSQMITPDGPVEAGFVVNCAGAYADKVARDFGFSEDYRILPFKGLYLYSDEPAWSLKTNIYPVPDLRNPFLGVHFTVTTSGHAKIGPTALPAFWREQYGGIKGFRPGEFATGFARLGSLFLNSGFDFASLALSELKKCSRRELVRQSQDLASGVDEKQFKRWGPTGIRAQLMNLRTRKLEMDFILEGDMHSIHVLNAVSPAWTCAIPFASYVCDRIETSVTPEHPSQ
ncbi:MAG: FAD-dependent oxidoreductase [Verrucomicrobiota bacterium]